MRQLRAWVQPLLPPVLSRLFHVHPLKDHTYHRMRLIDLQARCVVDADSSWTYVCLSYVWGDAAIPKLTDVTCTNYYRQHGLEDADLGTSKTFADILKLVEELGFRYLWIDSLCILQDNSFDLGVHIP